MKTRQRHRPAQRQVVIVAMLATFTWLTTVTVDAQSGSTPPRVFSGHLGAVTMADFTPDGLTVGTSSADHTLKLWNAATGDEVATLHGNTAPVSSLAISPDGRILASGARDNTIKLWDIPPRKPLRIYAGHEKSATTFAFHPDATVFVSGGHDASVRLWDTQASGEPVLIEGHTAAVTALAYRADRNQVATADASGFIRLWRTIDSQPEGVLVAHAGKVTSLFYHSNNRQLISTGEDGLVKVWQLPIVPSHDIPGQKKPVDVATFSSDGQLLATAGTLGDQPTVIVRNVENGEVVATLLGHGGPVTSLAFNANHTRLATGAEDKTIRVWDLTNASVSELMTYGGHATAVRAICFADMSTVVSSATDNNIHHWALADGKLIRTWQGHTGVVNALAVSSASIASASSDGTIRIWNRANGESIQTISHGSPVQRIALSPDKTKVASWGEDKQLKLWLLADSSLLHALAAEARDVSSLVFSPNSQQLAATLGEQVHVWQVDDGAALQSFPNHSQSTRAVTFLSDSKTLISVDAANGLRRSQVDAVRSMVAHETGILGAASYQGGNGLATVAGDGAVKLWTTGNGQLARELEVEHQKLISVTASVNNQFIAGGARDGTVFVWNSGNGTLAATIKTPATAAAVSLSNESAVKLAVAGADQRLRFYAIKDQSLLQECEVESPMAQLTFLPGNARVAVAHTDGTIAEWAYASPVFTRNMTGHSGGVFNLAFSHDGATLVSASADKTLRLWNMTTGRQIRALSGHSGAVFGLALSSDSSWIVSAGGDRTIRLWDLLSGRQLKQIDAPGPLYTVAMHPDGKTVAAAGIDRQIFIYDVFEGVLKGTLEGHMDYIYRVVFNHTGSRLLSCGYSGQLIVWEFPSGKQRYSTRVDGVLNSVAYSPDDAQIVIASDNGTAQLLELPASAR